MVGPARLFIGYGFANWRIASSQAIVLMSVNGRINEGVAVIERHSGACLCGAVRFEIEGDFQRFFLCHCSRCRKTSGSAHGANLFSSTAKLKWLSGEEQVREFHVQGTRRSNAFCATCGSALPNVQMNGALLKVPAGSLDTVVTMRPIAHIFMGSKATWDEGLDSVPRVEGLPA